MIIRRILVPATVSARAPGALPPAEIEVYADGRAIAHFADGSDDVEAPSLEQVCALFGIDASAAADWTTILVTRSDD